MKKKYGKNLIFEDFIHDREVKMYRSDAEDSVHSDYTLNVQVFTLDNLPFSPLTGDQQHIFFDYEKAGTDAVKITGVEGHFYNAITRRYEVTDHTFVVGELLDDKVSETVATQQMREAAEKVIAELSKRIPMPPHIKHPKILTDVQRAEKLVTDRNVKITSLSKATGTSTYTLYNYRKNPASLHKASQATVDCLTSKYFETYFSRNEIERFRMMLINIVGAYLKETEGNPIAYDPAHALYTMCQKGDWHRLAKMEELWRASYSVERSL
ncbi:MULTISPECIES: XRE family transcriptional regulator [Lactobacillus]|uniref:XRE family transcriptional regulator n=1 Tax=Lactobacillus TaxID=1578 RepID=UPI000B5DB297|nr:MULTISPECIES: XRE family transcriptional regulator [Lactobacillus]OXC44387.1 hypothetical protein AYP94_06200 [Lactobacillus crispatus]OXC46339.1 hypothetical protein AYP95_03860 [Lactobacillus crispatus]PEG83224.1 XRE family transcriptional regulator [Lactobacillus sp. UMNPBX16]PEG99033.1 XRE family transcriptional regulator [Lactobacillus sp. UMNPBX8]